MKFEKKSCGWENLEEESVRMNGLYFWGLRKSRKPMTPLSSTESFKIFKLLEGNGTNNLIGPEADLLKSKYKEGTHRVYHDFFKTKMCNLHLLVNSKQL